MNRNHVRASRNGRAVRGAGTTFTGGSWGGCMAEGTSPREEWHLELRLVSQVWSASVGITHLCSIQQWKTTEVFYLLEKDKAHWRQTHFFLFFFSLSFVIRGQCLGFTFPATLTFAWGKVRVTWTAVAQGESEVGGLREREMLRNGCWVPNAGI